MSQCINQFCYHQNPDELEVCEQCSTPLVFNKYYRATSIIRESLAYQAGIFEAIDVRDGSPRILKVLSEYGTPRKLIQLYKRQFWALVRFRNPQIPSVDGFDGYFELSLPETSLPTPNDSIKVYGILLEKIEGQNLEEWLEQGNKLDTRLALDWYKQICEILLYVHSQEFIHRDIKPSNIILRPTGELVLIDFGTVRSISSTSYLVKLNTRVGDGLPGLDDITAFRSDGYSPQEQVRGKAIVQSDFFALGRTFVHLMTGVPPNQIDSIGDDRINWRPLARNIATPLLDFTDELIEAVPQKRPKSMEDILFKLSLLPQKIKLNRHLLAWYSRTFMVLFSMLALAGISKGISIWGANHYLAEGNKYFLKNSEYQIDKAKARKYFDMGLQYDSRNKTLLNNFALSCADLNDDKCASDTYKKLISVKPDWSAYYNFAGYYEDKLDYASAKQNYLKAITVSEGKVAEPFVNLAHIAILGEDYSAAKQYIQKGFKVANKHSEQAMLYKNRGWLYFINGNYKEAEKDLKASVHLDPSIVSTYCLMAQVREALHQNSEAWWNPCVRFVGPDSNSQEVNQWRSELVHRAVSHSDPVMSPKK